MAAVRMMVSVSGTRDGADWPLRGEVLVCADGEAADLVAAGLAEPVAAVPAVEAAALDTAPRKRAARKS